MISWANNLRAAFGERHALLFVIPGGAGGFPSANVDLYRGDRAFRDSIDATAPIVADMLGWDAAGAYRAEHEAPVGVEVARRNELVHHGLTRIALIDQWRSDGITPDGAIGVSLGEVIAPYAVGAISREDCTRLVTVVAQAVTEPPSAWSTYIVEADREEALRLCRTAPVAIHFLGMSSTALALVACRESHGGAAREWFGGAVVKEAPSGWPYHTPEMFWHTAWVEGHLGGGAACGIVERPIYSPAVGALLPPGSVYDAQCIQWMMTGPSHFAEAVSAALEDGFDTFVQVSAKPMHVLADVLKTAETKGRRVRQFHAFDPKARARLRGMRRRRIAPRTWTPTVLAPTQWSGSRSARQPGVERLAERFLQPLVAGKPFDVAAALADPIADAVTIDRDALRRAVTSSVLLMLRDDAVRRRVTDDPDLLEALAGNDVIASAALRVLLRVAPDFRTFQPLDTVRLGAGDVVQLMIVR